MCYARNMEWRNVVGYEDRYQVSETGLVRGLASGKTLSPGVHNAGYHRVVLYGRGAKRNFSVHRLVAEAFLPNPTNLPLVRHLNGNPADNRVQNLSWGTQSDNIRDSVRHRTHRQTRKTHCYRGHPIPEDRNSYGQRRCRECTYLRTHSGMSDDDPRHGSWAGYQTGCKCDECMEAMRAARAVQRSKTTQPDQEEN